MEWEIHFHFLWQTRQTSRVGFVWEECLSFMIKNFSFWIHTYTIVDKTFLNSRLIYLTPKEIKTVLFLASSSSSRHAASHQKIARENKWKFYGCRLVLCVAHDARLFFLLRAICLKRQIWLDRNNKNLSFFTKDCFSFIDSNNRIDSF